MFKFNFSSRIDNTKNVSESKENLESKDKSSLEWIKCEEILVEQSEIDNILKLSDKIEVHRIDDSMEIKYISTDVSMKKLSPEDSAAFADNNHSDLVESRYEGGLKIWECTIDLMKHITLEEKLDFNDKTVLDLGCGTGIIGCIAHIKKARTYFQDYNEEVIKYATIPNVVLNSSKHNLNENIKRSRFFKGDWESFVEVTKHDFKTEEHKFDYILTSETIYNPQNYKKLIYVFKHLLKNSGIIYLAAKTHYFGVGGSVREFEDCLRKENIFNFSTSWRSSEGLQREILKIFFKK